MHGVVESRTPVSGSIHYSTCSRTQVGVRQLMKVLRDTAEGLEIIVKETVPDGFPKLNPYSMKCTD